MIEIHTASADDKEIWNAFLASKQYAYHEHRFEWREIISESFGHTPHYLLAKESGRVCGVFPLFLVSSMLSGKALLSVPYLNAGGPVGENDEIEQVLLKEAIELSKKTGARFLEVRNRTQIQKNSWALTERTHKVAVTLEIQGDTDRVFEGFSSKLRSQIRRPERDGVQAKVFSGAQITKVILSDFYKVFSENMRDLGTPSYPKSLFKEASNALGDDFSLILAYKEETPIAGGVTIKNGTRTEILWASSLRRFNSLSPNMLMYWHAIKHASMSGSREFDFGRSTPGTGPHKFKLQWGAKEKTLHWYYHMIEGELPDINPRSSKYALLVGTWSKLPLCITRPLGGYLTRHLP
jgi:serine/alanine adding enzyme